MSTTTQRLSGLGDSVGHVLGDAWSHGSHLAHDLADATAERAGDAGHALGAAAEHVAEAAIELRDRATGRRRRRRPQLSVRRVLVMVGVGATLVLLVLAARRSREPWADEYDRELEPGDPRADSTAGSARAGAYATT